MDDLKKETKKKEDEYFARLEFDRRKEKLQEQQQNMKKEETQKLKELHWMHCPKCGMKMVEVDFEGIKVDKCSACLGIFFDDGEVHELIEKNKPGFLRRLSSIFED